jgi:hypothetical protein
MKLEQTYHVKSISFNYPFAESVVVTVKSPGTGEDEARELILSKIKEHPDCLYIQLERVATKITEET